MSDAEELYGWGEADDLEETDWELSFHYERSLREEKEEEIKRLRKALHDIAGAENRIVVGFTADGEGTAHTVLPPDPYRMQEIAIRALRGEK